ncbi:MAG: hypothetical protein R3F02_10745 [Thiolinea sp.]
MTDTKHCLTPGVLLSLLLTQVTGTAYATETLIQPQQVISSVTTDWNDDGAFDRAVLVDAGSEDGADLYIYLSDRAAENGDSMKLNVFMPGFAWKGNLWGMQPSLALNDANSLIVRTENTGIGREAWNQKLTVAWRDGQFIVAGYTYDSYDRIDPDNVLNCDLNLLTGRGIRNGKDVTVPVKKVPLKEWTYTAVQTVCFEE